MCVWGFHEESTIAAEGIKLEYTQVPSTPPPPQTCAPKNFRWFRWGAERMIACVQTRERGPPSTHVVQMQITVNIV
jgi:hypothetical protein